MISKRAQRWTREDPHLVRAHFACSKDPFDATNNPRGFVNFGTAENHIVFDALAPLLRHAMELHETDVHYNELHGALVMREAVAAFLSQRAGRQLSPDHIALASGASAILETLAFVLCDTSDSILVPSPYYPGFDHDLGLRPDAQLLPVPLTSPGFHLRLEDIRRAHAAAVEQGRNVTAILLNSPQNPLGHVYDETLMGEIVAFASRNNLHVIVDEIYAESLLPKVGYCSALRFSNPLVHVVYGFAKDFGLSGYKVGILHSEHPMVIRTSQDLAYFHSVSVLTQRVLASVLRDARLVEFWRTLRARLEAVYRETTGALSEAGISFLPLQGGIVLWLDLRAFLSTSSFVGERQLCEQIFNQCRVSIAPGELFHCGEPGWFRLCFTLPEAARREGLRRLIQFLVARRR